jgi:hypothetical protein
LITRRKKAAKASSRKWAPIQGRPSGSASDDAPGRLQPYPAAARAAGGTFADQLDPCGVEGRDQLHQRVDVAAHDVVARFHPLDGRHRQARESGQLALVDAEQGAGRAHLRRGDHGKRATGADPKLTGLVFNSV